MAAGGEAIPPLPVVYVKCKDEAEAKEILLKLNSQYGKMTAESVKDFLGDLEIDFEDLALPGGFLDLKVEFDDLETQGDDDAPEADMESEPDSQPGEMYELGNSILMCGDSTSADDVAILMTGGGQADLCLTDPPYNVTYEGKTKEKLKIQNDSMGDAAFRQFLVSAFTNMRDNMKDGAAFYIWHADSEGFNFRGACHDVGFEVKQCLIWNKNSLVLGRQDYQWKHEPCLYGWKDGGKHAWYNDRKQTTVIDCKRPSVSAEHPTMKPVELFEYQIKNSTKAGDVVLDLFGGSGTTIIAAERCGRKARVMELDPKYCDVIRKRWTKWAKENGREVGSGGLE
jgi:site-specific DNA-methyltransferase (adenine-specific)